MSEHDDLPEDQAERPEKPEKPRVLPHLTQADLECVLDEHGRKHYFMADGRPVCGRLKKEKNRAIPDEACLGIPMTNGACRVHGGKAGAPIRTGRYARVMNTWQAACQRALADKQLLESRAELALMDVANEKLVERAEALDSPSWRNEVLKTFRDLRTAIRAQRHSEVGPLLKQLGDQLEQGATADQVAADLVAQVDRRAARACKVTELDLRREEKVTLSELAAIFRSWLDVMERRLEPEVYFSLAQDLRRVTSVRPVGLIGEGENGGGSAHGETG